MKKLIIYILSGLFCITLCQQVCAQGTFHFIYFSDTNDSEVGKSSEEANRYFINNFIPLIQKHTGMAIKKYICYGSDFARSKLNGVLSSLSTNSDDVIFFYYTGHGYNNGTNDFPVLTLGLRSDDINTRTKSLLSIYNTLRAKPHRLLFVGAEACNAVYQTRQVKGNYTAGYDVFEGENTKIRTLFRESSGDYLISSSKKGQKSFCPLGGLGYFSLAFRDALDSRSGGTTWSSFLNSVSEKAMDYADRYAAETQQPQWLSGAYSDSKAKIAQKPSSSYLSISPQSVSFSASGGTKTFSISASGSWYVSVDTDSWGILTKSGSTLTLRVSENNSSGSRSDYFKIKCGEKEVKVSITQKGKTHTAPTSKSIQVVTEISWMVGYVTYTGLMVIYTDNIGIFKIISPSVIIQDAYFNNPGTGYTYFSCSNPRYANGSPATGYFADNFVVSPNGQMYACDAAGVSSMMVAYNIINPNYWQTKLNYYGL